MTRLFKIDDLLVGLYLFVMVSLIFGIGLTESQRNQEHSLFQQMAEVNHKNEQTIQTQQRTIDALAASCKGVKEQP